MTMEAKPRTNTGQEAEPLALVLKRLHTALRHLQAAQMRLVTVLRPTHDRRLVNEALGLNDAADEELRELRDVLESGRDGAE